MGKKREKNKSPGKFDFFSLDKVKDNKLNRKSRLSWTEEAYINYSDKEINKSDKIFFGLSIEPKLLNIFLLIIFIGLGILIARSVQLQIINGGEYMQTAEQNRIRIYYVNSPRGIIYDRNEKPLVSNIPNFHLFAVPFDFPKQDEKINKIRTRLESILNEDLSEEFEKISEIKPRQRQYYEPMPIYENIPYQKALNLSILTSEMPGVSVQFNTKRKYEYSRQFEENESLYNSLSHIIGYEGKLAKREYDDLKTSGYLLNDRIGKSGIELSYEKELRGEHGKKQIEVDSQGKEKKIIAKEDPVKGMGIILSVDLKVQNKLEEILRNAMLENEKKKGAAIALNPQNGEVLALVSLPSYNNNDFAKGIDSEKYENLLKNENKPLFNRAISGEYPSGSTIKPVIACAALEEGIINEHTTFLSTGGIRIGKWFFPDWRAGGHGLTDVKKAISDSVNTFFYIIGGGHGDIEGLGVEKISYYGALFGLSQLTGIDLTGEKSGFLPSPEWKLEAKNEKWYIGDTYHLAIGQGDLLVTPIQIANYTAVFANKGSLYQPRLAKEFIDSQTGEKFPIKPKLIRRNFVDSENINIVRKGMRQAVTLGSARILNSLPVSAAAKTGTAQWGTDKDPHAWFTSFAPYQNSEIVLTVLVEEGEEGSKISADIAYKFLKWYFSEYESTRLQD